MTTPNDDARLPTRRWAGLLAVSATAGALALAGAGVATAATTTDRSAAATGGPAAVALGPSVVVGCAGQYEFRPHAVRLHCNDAATTVSAIDWTAWTPDKATGVGTLDSSRVEIVLDLSQGVPGQDYRVFSRALLSGAQGVESVLL